MSTLDPRRTDPPEEVATTDEGHSVEPAKKGHSHWLMVACCIPMLVIAIALVAAGVVGAGFIVVAVMCTLMMGAMMMMMAGGWR